MKLAGNLFEPVETRMLSHFYHLLCLESRRSRRAAVGSRKGLCNRGIFVGLPRTGKFQQRQLTGALWCVPRGRSQTKGRIRWWRHARASLYLDPLAWQTLLRPDTVFPKVAVLFEEKSLRMISRAPFSFRSLSLIRRKRALDPAYFYIINLRLTSLSLRRPSQQRLMDVSIFH